MRHVAPPRGQVDPPVFRRMPLAAWDEYADLLEGTAWPSIDRLNERWPADARQRFVEQTPALLADGLHYEQRIASGGGIATRAGNWHDLLNALIWLRHPALKRALNARQVAEIARMGPKIRSRAQYALTHFDEAGVIVWLRDETLLERWDAHDWHGLFWLHRHAWGDDTIRLELFGHALLELALDPARLLVGKALVCLRREGEDTARALDRCAAAIAQGELLRDPLELRPLPLSGIPGWHPGNLAEAFHQDAACYQPRRAGRRYPPLHAPAI